MNNDIKKILEEIYLIDAEMRNHEDELQKIINELTKQKPNVVIDQVFIKTLREKIMTKEINPIEQIEEEILERPRILSFMNLVFSGVGALVMLLIMLPFLMPKTNIISKEIAKKSLVSGIITDLGNQAFGSLVAKNNGEALASGADALRASDPVPLAATANKVSNETAISSSIAYGRGGGVATFAGDAKMIAPYFPSYKYKYTGEDLQLDDAEAAVYKRIPGQGIAVVTENILSNLAITQVQLAKLAAPELQSFVLQENKEYGLQATINISEGTIDFYQNWQKWQNYYPNCDNDNCWEQNRMKIDQEPTDEAVLAKADEFVANYGIDLSGYGKGEVRNSWRKQYEVAQDKNTFYLPEDIQVVYPLLINNEIIYDSSGNSFGISVNVNVKLMRVSSMNSLRINNFESSNYQLETDKERIVKMAEKGGTSPIYYADENGTDEVSLEIVELGTPKRVLLSHWYYNEKTRESSELFVPALVFPVTKAPQKSEYFYQENLVIPLVKEILDTYDSNFGGPMPLLRENMIAPANTISGEASSASGQEVAPPQESESVPVPMMEKKN